MTIYGSDPIISNLTVLNADNVAVDLYGGASPTIIDLAILGGGKTYMDSQQHGGMESDSQ